MSYDWLLSGLWSEGVKNPLAEQWKSGSTISHPFDEFELIHFALNQTIVL
jgi:hypothetical protein